jgi:hypothetical protein
MIIYAPIIFILSFILSVFLNSGALSIFGQKPNGATVSSIITNVTSWGALYLVAKIGDWSLILILADALGDIMGDRWVAQRYKGLILLDRISPRLYKFLYDLLNPPRKKKPYLKRIPVTSA